MKKKIAIVLTLCFTVIIVLATGCVEQEPITPTSSPVPSPATPKEIPGLAYMKMYGLGYTDDANPEYEGIEVSVYYFDQKSELIFFRNTECTMAIKIYTTKYENYERAKDQLVYEGTATFDDSRDRIRIPYDAIPVEPEYGEYGFPINQLGIMEVTVHTPAQGDFHAEQVVVLYNQP